jgi:transcription initiation factor TFIIIB Brf1 subunit/transcription initiation factor TFIIB
MLDLNKKCSMCNKDDTTITDPESGEIICSNCGMVICERIEDTIHQERRACTIEEAYNRYFFSSLRYEAFHHYRKD